MWTDYGRNITSSLGNNVTYIAGVGAAHYRPLPLLPQPIDSFTPHRHLPPYPAPLPLCRAPCRFPLTLQHPSAPAIACHFAVDLRRCSCLCVSAGRVLAKAARACRARPSGAPTSVVCGHAYVCRSLSVSNSPPWECPCKGLHAV